MRLSGWDWPRPDCYGAPSPVMRVVSVMRRPVARHACGFGDASPRRPSCVWFR
jgi:hypothetical protein